MRSLLTLLLIGLSFSLSAQEVVDEVNEQIQLLYEGEKYEEAKKMGVESSDLNAEGNFFMGMCYYQTNEDEAAIPFFNKAIELDSKNSKYYRYKAIAQLYMGKPNESIETVDKAIEVNGESPKLWTLKGDISLQMENEASALLFYKKATEMEECSERAYMMTGQIHSDRGNPEEALKSYYMVIERFGPESDSYENSLYNIGLSEYLSENYSKSEEAYTKLLERNPDDYQVTSKLIQAFYGQKNYEKGNELKSKMYEGYEKETLPDHLKQMFCFDQFVWKDQRILVFERYAEPENDLYYKHQFYLTDKAGDIVMSVQTEHSFALDMMEKKYVLGRTSKGTHSSFFQYVYDEDFDYDQLKKDVISILEEDISPTSMSTTSVGGEEKKSKKKKKKKKKDKKDKK